MKVTLIDKMGTDITVVNAARVSFGKQSYYVPEYDTSNDYELIYNISEKDEKLIAFLARNKHWTPFGHPQLQFHIKAPIFVARQLAKHQVGGVWNEISRRYVDYEPEFYIPEIREKIKDKKQGSGNIIKDFVQYQDLIRSQSLDCIETYKELLASGVAPEIARTILPQNVMTEWYWTGSLYFMSRVVSLRTTPDAQKETRLIAEQIRDIMRIEFTISTKYLLNENENKI